jgi:hypothetical protein
MTERKFTPFVDDGSITEYMTTCGLLARVSAANSGTLFGYIKSLGSNWQPKLWFVDGSCHDSGMKLHDLPVKHTGWVNIYRRTGGNYTITGDFPSKQVADKVAQRDRVACTEVTFEEGEGL